MPRTSGETATCTSPDICTTRRGPGAASTRAAPKQGKTQTSAPNAKTWMQYLAKGTGHPTAEGSKRLHSTQHVEADRRPSATVKDVPDSMSDYCPLPSLLITPATQPRHFHNIWSDGRTLESHRPRTQVRGKRPAGMSNNPRATIVRVVRVILPEVSGLTGTLSTCTHLGASLSYEVMGSPYPSLIFSPTDLRIHHAGPGALDI